LLGIISKRLLISSKGEDWFNNTYKPLVGKISIVALKHKLLFNPLNVFLTGYLLS